MTTFEASTEPPPFGPGTALVYAGVCVAFMLVGVLAMRRFATGFGGWRREMQPLRWQAFLARLGFAALPATVGSFFGALVFVFYSLFLATDADVFGVAAVVIGGGGFFGSFIWLIKEFRRPSKWRHVPDWVTSLGTDP